MKTLLKKKHKVNEKIFLFLPLMSKLPVTPAKAPKTPPPSVAAWLMPPSEVALVRDASTQPCDVMIWSMNEIGIPLKAGLVQLTIF